MAESMPPVMHNHDGLSYEERWALWQDAKALSCRLRARKRLRTSSARRTRVSAWNRVRGFIRDVAVKTHEATPTFRSVIARTHRIKAGLSRNGAREWWLASVIRRLPGVTAWCFLFLALVIVVRLSARQPAAEPHARTGHQRWLRARAVEAIDETLAVIGHEIRIFEVEVKPLPSMVGAQYRSRGKAIVVNSDRTFSETELLRAAGHEGVHAIFYQAGLWPQPDHPGQYRLLEETAAYVLGAHLAGRVWSRRGFDGEALADRLVKKHLEACDPTLSDSVHWLIAESYGPDGRSLLTAEEELGLSGHFGSPEVVAEMDRICRLHLDPVDAARAIAERFGRKADDVERPLVVRADLRPTG